MSVSKKIVRSIILLAGLLVLLVILSNVWMILATRSHVYNSVDSLPHKKVGLVLGTTSKLSSGKQNPYFSERINTAADLYAKGKIEHFILSGDNNTVYYNEPAKMKEALMEKGIPGDAITLDFAGFRTLDSVIRCKEIFGQDEVTIITQQFHSYRALFISDYYSVDAVAIAASNAPFPASIRVTLREIIARPMAIIDLYILKTPPKFLGKKEYI